MGPSKFIFSSDIFPRILVHLSYNEKMRLREVCNDFRFVIDRTKFDGLMLTYKGGLCDRAVLWPDRDQICKGDLIYLRKSRSATFLFAIFQRNMFANLKRLAIDELTSRKLTNSRYLIAFFQVLNQFSKLESLAVYGEIDLETDNQMQFKKSTHFQLELPKLKYLRLHRVTGDKLILMTPSLDYLAIETLDNIELFYPQKLTKLNLISLDLITTSDHEDAKVQTLEKLTNLETLDLWSVRNREIDKLINLITNYSKFKKLSFLNNQLNRQELDAFANLEHVEVFVNGLNLNSSADSNLVLQIGSMSSAKFDEYLRKLDHLQASLPYFLSVNYSSVECLSNPVKSLLKKLTKLTILNVDRKVKDKKMLIKFLRFVNHQICDLRLIGSSLKPDFYLDLHKLLLDLKSIEIYENERILTKLNLNFLFNLKSLNLIKVNSELDFKFVESLFKRLGDLSRVYSTAKELEIGFRKCDHLERPSFGVANSYDEYIGDLTLRDYYSDFNRSTGANSDDFHFGSGESLFFKANATEIYFELRIFNKRRTVYEHDALDFETAFKKLAFPTMNAT